MAVKISNTTLSRFYCTKCGKEGIPCFRPQKKEREPGHLKRLHCIYCNEVTNHVEIKPFGQYGYPAFKAEFEGHNFDENGNRKVPWRQFIGELKMRGEY